jgi:hypothetical protein
VNRHSRITLGNKQSRVSFASTGQALLNQQYDRVAYGAVLGNHIRGDPIAFRCSPLYRRLPFAEVDFNCAEIGLSGNEQQVSHTFRAGNEGGVGDSAHEGRRAAALGCPVEPLAEVGVGVGGVRISARSKSVKWEVQREGVTEL